MRTKIIDSLEIITVNKIILKEIKRAITKKQ